MFVPFLMAVTVTAARPCTEPLARMRMISNRRRRRHRATRARRSACTEPERGTPSGEISTVALLEVLGHFGVSEFESEVPTPEMVAAWMVLGVLRPEAVPMWAAWWLVEGFDGEAVRALAGLSGKD